MDVFETEVTVRFNEVDGWGIVYYANYFTYIEVARAKLLEQVGLLPVLLSGVGYTAPIVNIQSDFRSSAVFNERLLVQLRLIPQITAKLVFEFKIIGKDSQKLIMEGQSTQVLLNKKGFMVFVLDDLLLEKMQLLHDFFDTPMLSP